MKTVQFSRPPLLVYLRPKFFYTLDHGHPVSPTRPPPPIQMIANQLKENIIQG